MKIRFKKVVAAITLICTLFSTSVVATTSEPVQLPVVNMVDVPVTGDDEGTNQPTIIRISNFLEGKTCTTKTPLGLFDTKINWLATVPSLESDAVELLKAVNKDIRDNNLEYNAIQPLFQFSEDISQFSCKDLALLNAILYQGDNYHDFYKLYKKHDILDEKHEGIFSCNYGLEDTNSKFENGILQSSRDKLLEINRNFGVNYEFDFYEPVWKFRDSLTAMEAYDDFEQKIKTRATETSPDGEDASLLRTAIDSVDINYSNGNEEFTEAGFERVLNEMGPNPSFIDAWNSHALLEVFKRVNKHLVGDQKSRMEDAIIEFAKRKLLVGDSSGTKYSVATVRQIYDRMLSTGLFTSSKLDDLKTFLDEQAVVEYDSPEEAIHNYVTHMDAASIYISGAEFKDALNSNYEGLEWLQLAYGYLDLFAECSPELVVEMWKILQSEDPESIDEIINRILKDKLLPDEIQICVPASGYMQEMEGLITQLYYDTNGASPSFEEFTPFTWYRYRLHSYTGNDIGEMYDRMLRLVYTYPIERYMTEDTFTMGIAYDGFLNWAKKFEGGSHEDTRVNFINNMHKRFLLDDTINSPNVLTFLMIHLDVSPREYIKGMMEKSEYDMLLGDLEYDFATATLSAEMFDVGVDSRNQIIVFWDSQCSTWEKIVLGVNEEKG